MKKHRLLLVDDEPELLAVNKECLEDEGFQVFTAKDVLQALMVLESEEIDLVISDMCMPGLSGSDLLQRINAKGLDADVMFLTAYGTVENAVECIQNGASDYLLKPFDLVQFLRKIRQVLAGREKRLRMANKGKSLEAVLAFGKTLSRQSSMKNFIRMLIVEMRKVFSPQGIVLIMPSIKEGDPVRRLSLGPLVTNSPDWIEPLGARVCALSEAAILSCEYLSLCSPELDGLGISGMCAPLRTPFGRTGWVLVLRDGQSPPYLRDELNLLSLYTAQAANAEENRRVKQRLEDMSLEVVMSYVTAVEAVDVYTRGHSERVGNFARSLGQELGLSTHELEQLYFAGLLHDVGKVSIPHSILTKPDRLTDEEFHIMRKHPEWGKKILSSISSFRELVPIVLHHHEHFDGSGYPQGLQGEDIPFLARAISVVDGYEAMTSNRAYQAARTPEQALAILEKGAGSQWDPDMVAVWTKVVLRMLEDERCCA